MADGTHVGIGSGAAGLTRTILDGFVPPLIPSSTSEEDVGGHAEEERGEKQYDEDLPAW